MADWNPAYPTVIGPQWMPTIPRAFAIAQGQPAPTFRIRSLAGENIAALRPAVGSNPAVTDRCFVVFDIYEEGDEAAQTVNVTEFSPSADVDLGNWTTASGGVVNLFQSIDDAVVFPPIGTDRIRHLSSSDSAYHCSVDSSGFSGTARVLRLQVACVIGLNSLPGTGAVEVGVWHIPTTTVYNPPGGIIFTNGLFPNFVNYVDLGEINPVTLLPWTPTDVQEFDAGDWALSFRAGGGTGANGPIVTAAALRVSWATVENRAAVATWRRPAGAVSSPITTDALAPMPAGTGAWAKTNAVNYLYVPRIAADRLVGGSAPIANDITLLSAQQDLGAAGNPPGLSSAPPAGPPAMGLVSIDPATGQTSTPWGAELVACPRVVVRLSASDSADSLPYLRDSSTTVLRDLTAAQQVGQRYTTSVGPRTYLGVKTVVRPPATGDATLSILIRRVSDQVQLGGTFTITAAQVRALPEIVGSGGFRYVEGFLSSGATLASGVLYEGQMVVTAGTWGVLVPSAVGAGGVSFGGTTNCARLGTISGGSSLTEQDLVLMFLEQPAAPGAPTARVVAAPLDGDGCWCTVGEIDTVEVDWGATALAGAFGRYEIERETDDGYGPQGWVPVWSIITEATSLWTDLEAPFDRASRYRVRVLNSSNGFSDWVATDWVIPRSRGPQVVLTSNHDPSLQVVYDREPDVQERPLASAGDQIIPIFGGDYQVGFSDPNERGYAEQIDLIVNFGRQPSDNLARPLNMEQVAAPLYRIARAVTSIPYVAVKHANGATKFGFVQLDPLRGTMPAHQWKQRITVTPLTGPPIPGSSA